MLINLDPWKHATKNTHFQILQAKYIAGVVGHFMIALKVNEKGLEYITSLHYDIRRGLRVLTPVKGETNLFQERLMLQKYGRDLTGTWAKWPDTLKNALKSLGYVA